MEMGEKVKWADITLSHFKHSWAFSQDCIHFSSFYLDSRISGDKSDTENLCEMKNLPYQLREAQSPSSSAFSIFWSLSEVCQGKWGSWQLNYSTVTLFCVLFPVVASDLSAVLEEWAWAIAPWNTHRCRMSNMAIAVTNSPPCAKIDITNQSLDWLVDITHQASFVSRDVAPEFSACSSDLSY